jgi:D-alanine-D-alanine ligase
VKSDAGADFGKVAVLMGGWSAEREISLKSGQAVLAALRRKGVDAYGIDAGNDMLARLREGAYDRAFIALHGRGGEDGVVQGALEVLGLPYTGSGVLGSALCMHKLLAKRAWRGAGLATPEFIVLEAGFDPGTVTQQLGYPVAVKPVLEGSSLGVTKVESEAGLIVAYENAQRFGGPVIAERWIKGKEYTAAMLGDMSLPLIRLETPRAFYDYEAKYFSDSTRYHCPCGLSAQEEQGLQRFARQAFETLGAGGWGRVDFMVDEQGQPWLIEVNTVPGMTDHSLVPMAARAVGIEFDELVLRILMTARR